MTRKTIVRRHPRRIKDKTTEVRRHPRRIPTMPQKIAMTRNLKLKDTDGDGVADTMDCNPYDPDKQDTLFKVAKGVQISARFEDTRSGFRHIAILYVDGQEVDRTKVTYQNRTWEAYEFESVMRKLLEKTDVVTENQKKKFLETRKEQESEKVEQKFKSVANVARLGDVFADTKKEKNAWKKRMLKAGHPELSFPDDWDTLNEEEKEERLNKVISLSENK